jgi:hypothetical protein
MSFFEGVLQYEDDEPDGHQRSSARSRYRWLLRPVLISLVLTAGGGLIMRVLGTSVPFPLIFMVLLAVQLLRRALAWIAPGPVPDSLLGRRTGRASADRGDDGLRLATGRWETRLSWARLQSDPHQFARTVQPRLIQLVDERLRLRHGVVRAHDPVKARALLGDALWTFVTTPVHTTMTPRDLAAVISQMEAL